MSALLLFLRHVLTMPDTLLKRGEHNLHSRPHLIWWLTKKHKPALAVLWPVYNRSRNNKNSILLVIASFLYSSYALIQFDN